MNDHEVCWMTRPTDQKQVLVMNIHAPDWADNHQIGIVDMTPELATRLLDRIATVCRWKAEDPSNQLFEASFWNYEVEYLPWDFDADCPKWTPDSEYDGRTEIDRIEVTDDSLEWKALIKHTDDELASPTLYARDLRQYLDGQNPWPVIEGRP